MEISGYKLKLSSIAKGATLKFHNKIVCANASDVGLIVYMKQSSAGLIGSIWSSDQYFEKYDSLKRWYPAGWVHAQFAFPYVKEGAYLRFTFEAMKSIEISKITIYCLP